MSINQRLKYFIKSLDLNANSFSKAIGNTTNVVITKILNGKGAPSYSTLEKVKKAYPELNMEWLMSGEGEMLLNENYNHSERIKEMEEIIARQKKHIDILMNALDAKNQLNK